MKQNWISLTLSLVFSGCVTVQRPLPPSTSSDFHQRVVFEYSKSYFGYVAVENVDGEERLPVLLRDATGRKALSLQEAEPVYSYMVSQRVHVGIGKCVVGYVLYPVIALFLGPSALASTGRLSNARTFYYEGLQLAKQGRFAESNDQFKKALQLGLLLRRFSSSSGLVLEVGDKSPSLSLEYLTDINYHMSKNYDAQNMPHEARSAMQKFLESSAPFPLNPFDTAEDVWAVEMADAAAMLRPA